MPFVTVTPNDAAQPARSSIFRVIVHKPTEDHLFGMTAHSQGDIVTVAKLTKDSAFARQGLRDGDDILEVNNVPYSSATAAMHAIAGAKVGNVELLVRRHERADRPEQIVTIYIPKPQKDAPLGLELVRNDVTTTYQVERLPESITELRLDITLGDQVLTAGGAVVDSLDAVERCFAAVPAGGEMELLLMRQRYQAPASGVDGRQI